MSGGDGGRPKLEVSGCRGYAGRDCWSGWERSPTGDARDGVGTVPAGAAGGGGDGGFLLAEQKGKRCIKIGAAEEGNGSDCPCGHCGILWACIFL